MRADLHFTVVGADVNLAVHPVGRAPGRGFEIFLPVFLAGQGIEAIKDAVDVSHVQQAVMNGGRAERAPERVTAVATHHLEAAVTPHQGGVLVGLGFERVGTDYALRGHVARLRHVHAQEEPRPLTVVVRLLTEP